MTIDSLKKIFDRDMDRLKTELDAFGSDEQLWLTKGDIKNTAGNLMLHICGNLQHFVGAILGESGYVRRRDDEFGLKNVERSVLEGEIAETKRVVAATLDKLTEADLSKAYPLVIFNNEEMTTNFFLIHLVAHAEYHMGQINYHRRILTF